MTWATMYGVQKQMFKFKLIPMENKLIKVQ